MLLMLCVDLNICVWGGGEGMLNFFEMRFENEILYISC